MRNRRPLLVILYSLFIWVSVVFSQEGGLLPGETLGQPKERPITVSATVADREPPPTAILLSPGNGQYVSTSRPSFRWKYSGDTSQINKQQLYIDGVLFQDNLPFSSANPNEYALEYQSGTGIFALAHTTNLADGEHTWKIRAYDSEGNTSESATWTFIIDTVSPVFAVTKIVDITTSIWAQDVSTVPKDAIEIPTRNPILTGKGEAGAEVVLTVRLPSDETETYAFTINEMGHWNIQLFDLPRGEILYLDFMITDAVGHISTLIDLPLIVETITIAIPGITDPIEIIIPPGLEPILEPILKPVQIVEKITYNPLDLPLPSSLQTTSQALPLVFQTPTRNFLKILLSWIGLILISSIPFAKITILLTRFGKQLTPHLFAEILRAIGLLPRDNAHGIAFDAKTQQPVPFTTIIFQGKTKGGLLHTTTKLTNKEGLYDYHRLPEGVHQAAALADNYSFPTLLPTLPGIAWNNAYRGIAFEQTHEEYTPSLLIPMDENEGRSDTIKNKILRLRARNPLLFICAAGIAVLLPSAYNLAAVILYIMANLNREWRDSKLQLAVVDQSDSPLPQTIVRVQVAQEPKVRSLTQTDMNGNTKLQRTPQNEELVLTIQKHGYRLASSESRDTCTVTLSEQQARIQLVNG